MNRYNSRYEGICDVFENKVSILSCRKIII